MPQNPIHEDPMLQRSMLERPILERRNTAPPLVSVIIPTYRRPELVCIAIRSVLTQTYAHLEVLVVSDGPDPAVRASVAALAQYDARLQFVELAENIGPARARNAGVLAARGEWLAFLDDDDEWLPTKLEHQMALADPANPAVMISCRSLYRHSGRDDPWPDQPIAPGQDLADYILIRPGLSGRPGVVSTHSLVVHRSILAEVPFTDWPDHEDWSWLLAAWHRAGARIRFVWLPLVVYNIDIHSTSRSRRTNWQDSLDWAETHRHWISDRAYRSFLTTKVALKARRAGDFKALASISRAVLRAHPTLLDLCFLVGIFLLPNALLNAAWKRSLRHSKSSTPHAVSTPPVPTPPVPTPPVYDKFSS